jgi:hypothetical protein
MMIWSQRVWLALGILTVSVAMGCKGMGTDMSSLSRVPPPGTGSYASPNSYYTPPSGSWSATPTAASPASPNNPSSSGAASSGGAAAGTGVPRSAAPTSGATSSANGSSQMGSVASGATIGTGSLSHNSTGAPAANQGSPVVTASTNRVSDNSVQTAIFEGEDTVTSKVVPASGGYSDKPSSSSASLPWRAP